MSTATRGKGRGSLHSPTNLIPTLDGYRYQGRYEDRQNAYRHIDQNWYFWTDF